MTCGVGVSCSVMRLLRSRKPRIVEASSAAISKADVSFNSWTTKGGRRGFFDIITHFADAARVIMDFCSEYRYIAPRFIAIHEFVSFFSIHIYR
jgi:hypothetical protein